MNMHIRILKHRTSKKITNKIGKYFLRNNVRVTNKKFNFSEAFFSLLQLRFVYLNQLLKTAGHFPLMTTIRISQMYKKLRFIFP